MNEMLAGIGLEPDKVEKYAPVLGGAVVCLVGLAALRVVGKGACRGYAAARRWYNTPALPPEPGSDAWLEAEILRLLDEPNRGLWEPTVGANGFFLKTADGSTVELYCDSRNCARVDSVRVTSAEGERESRDVNNKRINRAVRRLHADRDRAATAAANAKFNAVIAQVLDAQSARWTLTVHGPQLATGRSVPKDVGTDVVAVLAWAHRETVSLSRGAVVTRVEVSRVVPGVSPAAYLVASWTYDPNHACWVLDDRAGKLDYPGLAGSGVLWRIGNPHGFSGSSLAEALTAARKAESGRITIPLPVEVASGGTTAALGHVRV